MFTKSRKLLTLIILFTISMLLPHEGHSSGFNSHRVNAILVQEDGRVLVGGESNYFDLLGDNYPIMRVRDTFYIVISSHSPLGIQAVPSP